MGSNSDERLWNYYQRENTSCFDTGSRDKNSMIAKLIKKNTTKSNQICEVGLGNGLLLRELSLSRKVMGVDLCRDTIEDLKKKPGFSGIELRHGDIGALASICNDEKIDVVVTIDVIEHLDSEQLKKACKEIHDLLPLNGRWFINVPWNEDLKRNEVFCPHCLKTFHRVGHRQSFDEEHLMSLMHDCQFKVEFIKRIYPSSFILPPPLMWLYRIIAKLYLKHSASMFAMMLKK